MEDNKEKRVLRIELDNEVKKVSITGKNSDEKVVMRQDLSSPNIHPSHNIDTTPLRLKDKAPA